MASKSILGDVAPVCHSWSSASCHFRRQEDKRGDYFMAQDQTCWCLITSVCNFRMYFQGINHETLSLGKWKVKISIIEINEEIFHFLLFILERKVLWLIPRCQFLSMYLTLDIYNNFPIFHGSFMFQVIFNTFTSIQKVLNDFYIYFNIFRKYL